MSFIEEIVQGNATVTDLENKIEYWHTHDTGNSLGEFLGLSLEEEALWLKSDDSVIQDIVFCRKNRLDIHSYLLTKERP